MDLVRLIILKFEYLFFGFKEYKGIFVILMDKKACSISKKFLLKTNKCDPKQSGKTIIRN